MSNDTQPEIRFPGFTDDWEQRKLKEFGKSTGGTSIESEFVEGGKYKVISIGSYSEQSVYTDQNIRAELTDKTRNRVLNKGDLTMILNDKTASGNIIGRVLLIDSNDSYVYNQRTERIEPDHKKYDSQFLYHMLNAPMIRSKIIKQAQGNTQIYVNWSAIGELDYLVPNLDEQREIGAFFFNLNNLITLHQRKLDLLKETKKGFLQKMFPKNGAKVPEIRFPGFTDDWEQRRLKQLGEIQTGNTPPTNDTENYNKNGIMWVTPTDINNLVISDTAKKLSEIGRLKARIAMKGSILVTCIASIGKNTLALSDVGFNQQINALTPNKEFDSYFLLSQSGKWSEKMKILAGRGTMQIVNKTDFSNITTYVPKYREQVKIGHFFKQLDDTIMLHQRKLDLLKETKKGFLQKMFV
ncbi:restriction endonuclease subunit S [Enterococcus durans]|uniref:restriction endonuclease subunit S n=1 Tax=Enterococcus durans TaxID=53345 RepID=UPI0021A7DEAA|nr:restriction endonuclease subunit S [Enterococcus durans]MCT4340430.1 restriction endonuclease subunit S [Enterococcus durans]